MLRQMIYTQWKWTRMELGFYCVIGFVLPTVVMKSLLIDTVSDGGVAPISALLGASIVTGAALVVLAIIAAVSVAARPWIVDASRQHVLSLSLPVRWADFIRWRFAAGGVLLLAPAAAVWLGGMLAAATLPIPASLHAYPTSIAARFLLTTAVLYSVVFAIQHLAGKHAVKIVAAAIVAAVLAELVAQSAQWGSPMLAIGRLITTWPGPFDIIAGRWMLIDV